MSDFLECPHMTVMCGCGSLPNADACKEHPRYEMCKLRPEADGFDYCDEDSDDAETCYRYQRARAEALEAEVARLRELIDKSADLIEGVCSCQQYPYDEISYQLGQYENDMNRMVNTLREALGESPA